MASPSSRTLYRTAALAVICALGLGLASAQIITKRSRASKGPRAIGVLELFPNGKAWLRPVAIMIDGKFYDANFYKATPVPMALDGDIVYEATRNGESKGQFTVTGVRQNDKTWVAEGHWRTAESLKPRPAAPKKVEVEDDRPVLHRAHKEAPKASTPAPPETTKPDATKPDATKPDATKPDAAKKDEPRLIIADRGASAPEDPDRPILRRGKPTGPSESSVGVAYPAPATPRDLYPAFSDVAGAETRPYTYEWKPGEEQTYRNRLLAMAAAEMQPKATPAKPKPGVKPAAKPPAVNFQNVKLRVFDLSLSNEPVMVLEAFVPPGPVGPGPASSAKYVIVVARIDTYGDLRKVLVQVTDDQHLDLTPRLELIDAMDADGDGVGELLFRKTTDAAQGYLIARVTSDQLWPLFDTFAVR